MLDFVNSINEYLSLSLIFLLCGTGIYFSFRTKFIQVRKFGASCKAAFGNLKMKGAAAGKDGMSSFQSLATAIAAQIGIGNITGAASAIVSGGPGAIFWMWVSSFFAMSIIFAETTLAQKYKTKVGGNVTGGPVYYIRAAFRGKTGKVLADIFAVLLIFSIGFIGNMVQSNSIGTAFQLSFHIDPAITGVVVAVMAFFIFRGGMKSIASVVEKLVPIMGGFFMIISLIIMISRWQYIGEAIRMIWVGAFNPQAVTGGAVGISVREAVRFGVARGLFSNEAGMGTTPHAHAVAKVKHPCDQGIVAMMGVFIDTFVILSMTALAILTTGVMDGKTTGIELAQNAFSAVFHEAGGILIAICVLFFGFSSIIGWYFFGEQNIKYLFGRKAVVVYAILVCVFVIAGSSMKVDLVWALSDLFNNMMIVPNVLGLLALSGLVVKLGKDRNLM